ncbi:MAG: hypothetical protein PHN69_02255 [Candidatus Pacebacteria bacterium]|nr:hypothetical protein [Candidatus Paceibacterota bacterium]
MTDRHKTRRYIKIITIAVIAIIFVSYTLYEIQKVVIGPQIEVLYPPNGTLVSNSFTEIYGIAKNTKEISLNDRNIYIDEQGNFKEELLLAYGYNVLVLKASDKFGRKTEEIVEVIYK